MSFDNQPVPVDTRVARTFVKVSEKHRPKKILLCLSTNRTGGTALARLLAEFGCLTYIQPIKSILRSIAEDYPIVPWIVEAGDIKHPQILGQIAVVKETIGPYPGTYFDPLQFIFDLGFNADEVVLIPSYRSPFTSWASWKRMWEPNLATIENFVVAHHLFNSIVWRAETIGMLVVPFVLEALSEMRPQQVVIGFLRALGLPELADPDLVEAAINWSDKATFGADPHSTARFFLVPPEKFIEGVLRGKGLHFIPREENIDAHERIMIIQEGILDVYTSAYSSMMKMLSYEVNR